MGKDLTNLSFEEWQNKCCKDCYFADAKCVGTGKPCCRYSGRLLVDPLGHCRNRRGAK